MVHEASVDGSIPEGMDNNNYYIFDIEQAYKGRVDFRMSKRRRHWCDDCVPVKEILLEKLGGRAHDEDGRRTYQLTTTFRVIGFCVCSVNPQLEVPP
eukprot:scaffold468_cov209-Chaetoceros_neogracile.AAC.3